MATDTDPYAYGYSPRTAQGLNSPDQQGPKKGGLGLPEVGGPWSMLAALGGGALDARRRQQQQQQQAGQAYNQSLFAPGTNFGAAPGAGAGGMPPTGGVPQAAPSPWGVPMPQSGPDKTVDALFNKPPESLGWGQSTWGY